jgi:hypothetical protein
VRGITSRPPVWALRWGAEIAVMRAACAASAASMAPNASASLNSNFCSALISAVLFWEERPKYGSLTSGPLRQ